MVRHIVMYRLKDENKEENARQMKEKLEGLNGKIEGLHGLRIDRDCNSHQYDVCLTADFDDLAALKSYKKSRTLEEKDLILEKLKADLNCVRERDTVR